MNNDDAIKKLEELKSLPVCKAEDVFSDYDLSQFSQEQLLCINEYLKDFIKSSEINGKCMICEKELFVRWTFVHGIAMCVNCGNDVKMIHYINDKNGKQIVKLNKGLQYHGNCLILDEDDEENIENAEE